VKRDFHSNTALPGMHHAAYSLLITLKGGSHDNSYKH
jgi:hypothetical protein